MTTRWPGWESMVGAVSARASRSSSMVRLTNPGPVTAALDATPSRSAASINAPARSRGFLRKRFAAAIAPLAW